MTSAYTFCRGDVIALALQCVSGDPTMVSSVRAQIKVAQTPSANAISGIYPSATALVNFIPANGGALAYWLIVIASGDSFNLPSGQYILDAELNISGIKFTTHPAMIDLQEPATAPISGSTGQGATWSNSSVTSPNGTMVLQWSNDMDASATIFPAINFAIDPNLIEILTPAVSLDFSKPANSQYIALFGDL